MNKDFERTKNIDAYLSGDLSREEAAAFEEALRDDESLQHDLETAKTVIEGIEGHAFKQAMHGLNRELYAPKLKTGRTVNFRYVTGIAASLLLICAVIYLLIPPTRQDFDSYFTPFPPPAQTRDAAQSMLPPTALAYYSLGEFDKAIAELEKIDGSKRSDETWFYLGVSYLGNRMPADAMKSFEKIQSPNYKEFVSWYTALAYLQLEQTQQAKMELSGIGKREYQYDNAQKILHDLP